MRYNKNEKKLRILESAMLLIAKNGYKGSTMRQIAKKANLTTGSIYNCFESKAEILLEIQKDVIDNVVKPLENFPKNFSATEKLEIVIISIVKSINDKRSAYKIMVDEFNHFPTRQQRQVSIKAKKIESALQEILEEGIRNREFKKYDAIPLETYCKMLTFFVLGSCNYASRWLDSKGELSYEAVGKLLLSTFLNGICSEKSKNHK